MPTAAGLHYFLHEGGSRLKAPLVLIHEAGGEALSWPAEVRRLPGTNAYTLDLPGHGRSRGAGCQSVEDYSRSVLTFMNAASLSRAVYGGHGLGGAIALELVMRHPERAAGILLISSGERLPLPQGMLENAAHPSTLPKAIEAFSRTVFAAGTPAAIQEAYCRTLVKVRQTLLLGDWRSCEAFDARGRLEQVHTPALVICGGEDRLTPLLFSKNLSCQIPGAALQVVEGAGHMLPLEQPLRLAKLMEIFLKTIPYAPGH